MITGRARLAGVMGWPAAHSLSPALHNRWIEALSLDAAYVPLSVRPEDAAAAFRLLPRCGFSGWNVTVPHKEAALSLVDRLEDSARAIGAVNTVTADENGALTGANTDAEGFLRNLREKTGGLERYKQCAVILGAGGAARAVAYALKEEGWRRIVIVNRSTERAEALAGHFGAPLEIVPWKAREAVLGEASLLVNATLLGMQGAAPLSLRLEALPKTAAVADLVYRPLWTELLKEAKARGHPVVTGIGMLIHQAAPGFSAWFGREPAVTPALEEWLSGLAS